MNDWNEIIRRILITLSGLAVITIIFIAIDKPKSKYQKEPIKTTGYLYMNNKKIECVGHSLYNKSGTTVLYCTKKDGKEIKVYGDFIFERL